MAVIDTLLRARELVASGQATDLVQALRRAAPSVAERMDAYLACRDARLPGDTPLQTLDAAIAELSSPATATCAYCGAELAASVVVPGARRGMEVCPDCAPQAAADSAAITALRACFFPH